MYMTTITTISTSFLALWVIALSVRVIVLRRRAMLHGTVPAEQLERAVRGQANSIEYIPIFLLLLFVGESHKVLPEVLLVLSVLFCMGRVMHGTVFSFMTKKSMLLRAGGTMLTLLSISLLALVNLYYLI